MHWTVEWTLRGLLIGASILTDADRWPSMPFLVRAFLSSHYHYTGWRISIWLSTNRYFRPLAEFFINKSVRFALDMFQVFAAPISTIWELTGQVISITDAPTAPPIKRPPSTYQYWSITADREIRLLELSAGDKDAPLRGRIIHIPLDEAPPYVALSYCWKDDSVCIDQEHNPQEKSRQVALMGNIYQQSKMVRVWLGDEAQDGRTEKAFRLAEQVAASTRETDIITQPDFLAFMSEQTCKQYKMPSHLEAADDYIALMDLLDRPWFRRSWVVQEAALGIAVVFCGSNKMMFSDLSQALCCCISSLAVPPLFSNPRGSMGFMAMTMAIVSLRRDEGRPSRSLIDVSAQHRCCEATNPEDKVFAFLNIADDAEEMGMRPDYTLSSLEVFVRTTVAMLRYYKHLDVLSAAHPHLNLIGVDPGGARPAMDLPSWIADWNFPGLSASLRGRGIYGEEFGRYASSGRSEPQVNFTAVKKQEDRIGLRGFALDDIVEVGDVVSEPYVLHRYNAHRVYTQWERMCNARSRTTYRPTGEDMLVAYASILTCGGEKVLSDVIQSINKEVQPVWNVEVPRTPRPEDNTFAAQYLKHFITLRTGAIATRLGVHWLGMPLLLLLVTMLIITPILVVVDLTSHLLLGRRLSVARASAVFTKRLCVSVIGRRFVRTRKGYIGLANGRVGCGDYVALLAGGKVPLVIRDSCHDPGHDIGPWLPTAAKADQSDGPNRWNNRGQ
ncbi:heterokaryon incompatibility protein-domain-containing protein [Schizothecium vesticola]|uniref:Heterokaryon incompatibility protein-domain-containing protein n=1 Tax=Schizothecium vesticola TaxID=314040 RepID=A0AA40K7Q4_9PEZI|nr:heterokaryon incompatibility protein-domain-containing protein [Schizothecium vesticola]